MAINNDESLPKELSEIMNTDVVMQAISLAKDSSFEEALIIKLDNCLSLNSEEKAKQLTQIIISQQEQIKKIEIDNNKEESKQEIITI